MIHTSFLDRRASVFVLLLATASCGNDGPQTNSVVFLDAQGRLLSLEDLKSTTAPVRYEIYDASGVPAAAKTLHQQGRDAGTRGNYKEAVALLTRAAEQAPDWPYPVYDRAYTQLLQKNFDAALADYRRTVELAPRGFFTAFTAVDTLTREKAGEFPPGLYLAYLMLEPIQNAEEKRDIVVQFVQKYPRFAPGWKEFANLSDKIEDRVKAIENGLKADPDPDTRGMLLLNQALVLDNSGQRDAAQASLKKLATDPQSTLATVSLAEAMLKMIAAK